MKPLLTAKQLAEQKELLIIKDSKAKTSKDWVPLGYALGPHGIKGGIKLHILNPESTLIQKGASVGFLLKSDDLVVLKISTIKPGFRITFEQITDRDEAEAFKGAELFMNREEMPQAEENEVYLVDLLGAEAIDLDGNRLGEVTGFTDNNAQDLVEILTESGEKVLVPFVHPILQEISEAKNTIVLDPPLGLF